MCRRGDARQGGGAGDRWAVEEGVIAVRRLEAGEHGGRPAGGGGGGEDEPHHDRGEQSQGQPGAPALSAPACSISPRNDTPPPRGSVWTGFGGGSREPPRTRGMVLAPLTATPPSLDRRSRRHALHHAKRRSPCEHPVPFGGDRGQGQRRGEQPGPPRANRSACSAAATSGLRWPRSSSPTPRTSPPVPASGSSWWGSR